MKLVLFLILLGLKLGLSVLNKSYDVQMIVDFVNSYNKPTALIARVCWIPSKKTYLMNLLADTKNPKTVQFLSKNNVMDKIIPKQNVLFLVDIDCMDSKSFFQQADATKKFGKPYRWLIIGNHINMSNAIPLELRDLSISVDSEVILAQQSTGNKEFTLCAIYRMETESDWYLENFGSWTYLYGLNKSPDMEVAVAIRRKNLRKVSIAISVVISDNRTKTELFELKNILIDTLSKSTIRHINPLYDFINATKVLIFADTWGYFINGSWGGMIGNLARGEAELGGTVTFITKQRLEILEYLSHPSPITAKFVFREPPLSYQNNLFLLPFKANVWYCTAGFVVILTFVLYVNAQWETRKADKYKMKAIERNALRPSVSDIGILVVSAISQQGSAIELKGTLGRLVMFILFLTFLFLYTSYSANIVVLLQSSSNQIRTLSDLLNSKLELGVEDVAYNRYYFSTATEPVRKAIYETKVAPTGGKPNFLNVEEGVRKLQNKPFAFNMNIGMGYKIVERYFYEHEKCGLQEIEYIQDNKPWLCCRKYSPFREIYKIGFFRIKEHGLSDRENRLIYAKKPVCAIRGGSFGSVNMVDFYPVLLMLLYGMILSFFLLLLEILVHRRPTACGTVRHIYT